MEGEASGLGGKWPVPTSSLDQTVAHLVTDSIRKPQAFSTEDSGPLSLQPDSIAGHKTLPLQAANLQTGTKEELSRSFS